MEGWFGVGCWEQGGWLGIKWVDLSGGLGYNHDVGMGVWGDVHGWGVKCSDGVMCRWMFV